MSENRLPRNDRRRILKDDEAWVGKPFDFGGDPRAIQANTRHMALMLIENPRKDRASLFAGFAEQLLDATMAKHIKPPVACAKGCAHCCTTFVSATIPEVLRLARSVRQNAPRKQRAVEVGTAASLIPQLEREARRVTCPMIEDHACAEYAVRPVVCRYVLSKSLESCVRIFTKNIPEPMPYPDGSTGVRASMIVMMKAALILAGLAPQHIELSHGLAIALSADDTEARWLAGEPIFAAVATDRVDQESGHLKGLVDALVKVVRPTI